MPGVFVIRGWQADAAIFVEEVVAAEDVQAAEARARARGLRMIVVQPYAPKAPPSHDSPAAGPEPVSRWMRPP